MDREAALEFIRHNHHAVLATTRADGEPQLSPVAAGVDEAGTVVVSTRETAVKTRNLRRRPRASLAVLKDSFFGEWIQVEGPVEIVSLPDAMDGRAELLVPGWWRGQFPVLLIAVWFGLIAGLLLGSPEFQRR